MSVVINDHRCLKDRLSLGDRVREPALKGRRFGTIGEYVRDSAHQSFQKALKESRLAVKAHELDRRVIAVDNFELIVKQDIDMGIAREDGRNHLPLLLQFAVNGFYSLLFAGIEAIQELGDSANTTAYQDEGEYMIEELLLFGQRGREVGKVVANQINGNDYDNVKNQREAKAVSMEEEKDEHGTEHKVGGHATIDASKEEESHREQNVADDENAYPDESIIEFEVIEEIHEHQDAQTENANHSYQIGAAADDGLNDCGKGAKNNTYGIDHICRTHSERQYLITRVSIYELL
jgi:hypothetical protein